MNKLYNNGKYNFRIGDIVIPPGGLKQITKIVKFERTIKSKIVAVTTQGNYLISLLRPSCLKLVSPEDKLEIFTNISCPKHTYSNKQNQVEKLLKDVSFVMSQSPRIKIVK